SLAKSDRRIAARYLALGGRDDLTAMVLAEYDLTRRLVLAVTGHDRLLADRPILSRAVTLRDPYVDALSHLQLRALAELRAAPQVNQRAAPRVNQRAAPRADLREAPAGGPLDGETSADRAAASAQQDRLHRLLLLPGRGGAARPPNPRRRAAACP